MVRNFRIGKSPTKRWRENMTNIKGKVGTVICTATKKIEQAENIKVKPRWLKCGNPECIINGGVEENHLAFDILEEDMPPKNLKIPDFLQMLKRIDSSLAAELDVRLEAYYLSWKKVVINERIDAKLDQLEKELERILEERLEEQMKSKPHRELKKFKCRHGNQFSFKELNKKCPNLLLTNPHEFKHFVCYEEALCLIDGKKCGSNKLFFEWCKEKDTGLFTVHRRISEPPKIHPFIIFYPREGEGEAE